MVNSSLTHTTPQKANRLAAPTGRIESPAAIPTRLMIRARCNAWLTESDMRFLDSLAPEGALAFLIHDRRFVHPRDIELFSPTLVEGAALAGGSAIFSHRCINHRRTGTNEPFRILTSLVGNTADGSLIFGLFAAEHVLDSAIVEMEFTKVADSLRSACRAVDADSRTLDRRLCRRIPTMIVERTSGEIVVANQAAVRLLERPQSELLGLTYEQIKEDLRPIIAGGRLAVANATVAGLETSIVEFVEKTQPERLTETAEEYFAGQFRSAVSAIMLATGTDRFSRPTQDSPSGIILSQCERIESLLSLYTACSCAGRRPLRETSLLSELEAAADAVELDDNWNLRMEVDRPDDNYTVTARDGLLATLFELLLTEHTRRAPVQSEIVVTLKRLASDNAVACQICSTLEQPETQSPLEAGRRQCIDKLTSQLPLRDADVLRCDGDTLLTAFTCHN